jgi:hypothetical protein
MKTLLPHRVLRPAFPAAGLQGLPWDPSIARSLIRLPANTSITIKAEKLMRWNQVSHNALAIHGRYRLEPVVKS